MAADASVPFPAHCRKGFVDLLIHLPVKLPAGKFPDLSVILPIHSTNDIQNILIEFKRFCQQYPSSFLD